MHLCSTKQMKQSEPGSPRALARRFVGNRVTMTVAGSARALGLPAKAPGVEGEAGSPVAVVSLPGRRAAGGRPQGRP
jgi:hypothetical protein